MSKFTQCMFAVALLAAITMTSTVMAAGLYWTDSGTQKIQSANLDGSNVQDFISTGLGDPRGIDIDPVNGHIYWAEYGNDYPQPDINGVHRADIDNPSTAQLLFLDIGIIDVSVDAADGVMFITHGSIGSPAELKKVDLATYTIGPAIGGYYTFRPSVDVDEINNRVFWVASQNMVETFHDYIGSADYDGNNSTPLIFEGSMFNGAKHVAVDGLNGKIYWTGYDGDRDDCCDLKIRSANLNGTDEVDLININSTGDIALDVLGGKMYWTESGLGEIWRANFDGSDPEAIVTGLTNPVSIALNVPVPEPTCLSILLLSATTILRRRNR